MVKVTTITHTELEKLLKGPNAAHVAVVDVRCTDFPGGNIKGAINVPSPEFSNLLPALAEDLRSKEIVVFHCMYSAVRGPRCAKEYARRLMELMPLSHQTVAILEGGYRTWKRHYASDNKLTENVAHDLRGDLGAEDEDDEF